MDLPTYSLDFEDLSSTYYFESIGRRGVIQKAITFSEIESNGFYNLALADIDPNTDGLEYAAITDNGDTPNILATVYQSIKDYTQRHPERAIVIAGSSPSRNRLYRMAINHSILEIFKDFAVFGLKSGDWELFKPAESYEFFLIIRR